MDKETQARLKSPLVWGGIVGQLIQIILVFSGQDVSIQVNLIWATISSILLMLGVFNNPTDKQKF